jgi:hypothetical protein
VKRGTAGIRHGASDGRWRNRRVSFESKIPDSVRETLERWGAKALSWHRLRRRGPARG